MIVWVWNFHFMQIKINSRDCVDLSRCESTSYPRCRYDAKKQQGSRLD